MCNFRNGIIRWQISKSVKVVLCIIALALAVSEILTFQIFYLKKYVKVTECNFRNYAIRWQKSKSTKELPHIFTLALIVSET